MKKHLKHFLLLLTFLTLAENSFSQYLFDLNDLIQLSTLNSKKFKAFVFKKGYSTTNSSNESYKFGILEYFSDISNPDGLRNKVTWSKGRKKGATISFHTTNVNYRKDFETKYLTKENGWVIDKSVSTENLDDRTPSNGYYTNGKFGVTILSITYGGIFWHHITLYSMPKR